MTQTLLHKHAQMMDVPLEEADPDVYAALIADIARQENKLQLIASENFVSRAVLRAMGSVFTNKYAEGYPGKRYYGGCEYADVVENLAIERVRRLFAPGDDGIHANVQPHSGTQANMAVYFAALDPGDTLMGLDLAHGGHLTHGHPLSYSGKYFRVVGYQVDRTTEAIDYDAMAELARRERPKLVVCGASAYSRTIDFARIRAICDEVGALMMADIAHIAGLVATGLHPSPLPHADFVTSTTHKTLRGPRGGMILCKKEWAAKVDRALFPGLQGGPLVHVIAAKAVAFREALSAGFREYQQQVVANARALAEELVRQGMRIVSGGTENHLMLVDLGPIGMTGKDAEALLELCGVTTNKNAIPFDPNPPRVASGIRVGTPAATTRGLDEADMRTLGATIGSVLKSREDPTVQERARAQVADLCRRYPLYATAIWP